MAVDNRLPPNLQTALLTVLGYDQTEGATVADIVRPEHFDPSHRPLAQAVLRYRREYSRPPGSTHMLDLAAEVKMDKSRLFEDVEATARGLNAKYIASRAADFVRRQMLKTALIEGGERFSGDEEGLIDDVEKTLYKALRFRAQPFEAGISLADPKALGFLEQKDEFISLGIPEMDRLSLGMRPAENILYIAPKGSGKSWFCVHAGKQALMQRKTVAHISLEMGTPVMLQRYYQSLFAISRRADEVTRMSLEFDEFDRLTGFSEKTFKPKLNLRDPDIRRKLRDRQKQWGARLDRLVVQAFPTRQLTFDGLVNWLDFMEASQNFRPQVLIVDYPDLMAIGSDNYRLDLNVMYERLRGLCVERNMAGVFPTQGNRSSLNATTVRSDMSSEGMGKVNTADLTLTYSRTKQEAKLGLARLSLEHVRNEESGSVIVLAQSYHTGQYVIESAVQQLAYWDKVKEAAGDTGEKDD